MFSRLQAALPLLKEEVPIYRWIKKIFPWKTNRGSSTNAIPDNRKCYRLDLSILPPLDATLVSRSGTITCIRILNLSASGVSGRISAFQPLAKGQLLTIVFVLPLEEVELVKTQARLIAINSSDIPNSKVVHLDFSASLEAGKKELIHEYIVKKQFEMIQQLRGPVGDSSPPSSAAPSGESEMAADAHYVRGPL